MAAAATNPWITLIGRTLVDARGAAATLNALRFNRGILWSLLLLVSILSVLVLETTLAVLSVQISPELARVSPFGVTAILMCCLTMITFALYFTGQALGGAGRFPGALLMVIWWQVVALALQLVQTFTLLFLPFLSSFVSLAGLGFMFYCLLIFVDELHAFRNILMALMTIVLAFIGILFGLSLILTLIGVSAQGGLA